jgi:DNA-directed RNA polymerase specialized sigma24 family protein
MDDRQSTARRSRNGAPLKARVPASVPAGAPAVPADAVPPVPPRADVALNGRRAANGETPALDPRDPQVRAKLLRRIPGGAYDISEADLVRAIRAWDAVGETAVVRELCELLVDRCTPEFQRRSWGLRHRPELMQDAIGGMVEQLLREVRDPNEQFLLLNFIHYLHCLCADNFSRVLRQEGLSYRRDEQGRPLGRPQHIPRALVERIDVPIDDGEESMGRDIPAAGDALSDRLAAIEAQRILTYLSDPLDRKIMYLRVFEQLRWDDIAAVCGKTERTMRLRYEKSRALLRERIETERASHVVD